jgi:PEGA domain
MRRAFVFALAAILFSLPLAGQEKKGAKSTKDTAASAAPVPLEPVNVTSAKGFVLEDTTPMRLRFNRTVSSADAHVGDTVDFEVLQDISVNGVLVIPKGGLAFGTVTEAQPKRRMARGGKLEINLDYVKLLDSEKAALRAVKGGSGGGHTGAMTAGIVATGLVFFPAAPFFLFMHGKDITLPKGAEVTAYVNGDVKLNPVKFVAAPVVEPATPASIASAANSVSDSAKLRIDSVPTGADIEVDGSFAGNSPSDVQVSQGSHTIIIKKTGFKDWERKITINSGSNVHLSAEMEKTATP